MKKILSVLAVFAVLVGSVFAQTIGDNPDDPFERERFEKEKLTTQVNTAILSEIYTDLGLSGADKNASIKTEYQPMHDELRIYYETLYVTFDKGEAMNAVKACLEKFVKDKKYYNYKYMDDDRI